MADQAVELEPTPTAAAESLRDFVKLRGGGPVEPAKQDPAPAKPQTSSATPPKEEVKTVETPEPQKKEQEQKGEPPEKSRYEKRIDELVAQRGQADRELQAEREERKRLEARIAVLEPAKREATPAAPSDDPEPDENDPKYATYSAYVKDVARWEARQERRALDAKAAETAAQTEQRTRSDKFLADGRAKFADFDQVTQGVPVDLNNPPLGLAGIAAAVLESEDGPGLTYALAKDSAEYQRIAALAPPAAYRAVVALELKLKASPAPEPKKTPVSRAPAPPASVGGTEPPEPGRAADARSMSEFKRLRAKG